MNDGTIVVANVIRGRWEWPQAVRMIATTAQQDGAAVSQGVEVVGAQVGALQTLLADPLLAGLTFIPVTVHADKLTRALPTIARAEQGKLAVVRAGWNREFLDELCAFPETRHDDQVDGLAAGCSMLTNIGTGAFSSADGFLLSAPDGWFVPDLLLPEAFY